MERPQPQLGTQNQTAADRVLAWFADTSIIVVISIVAWVIFWEFAAPDPDDFFGFVLVVWGVGSFGYHTYFEASYGQTFGKRLRNIVVVSEDGEPCDWFSSTIRNIVRIIDSILFYLVGIIVIFLSDNDQRLGDIAANTLVTEVAEKESESESDVEIEIEEKDSKPESDFEIELHHEEGSGERYVVLLNKSGEEVDLSRAQVLVDSDPLFPFPQGETAQKPGQTKSIPVPKDTTIEPGSSVLLLTQSGQRYDVSWHGP